MVSECPKGVRKVRVTGSKHFLPISSKSDFLVPTYRNKIEKTK